MSKNRDKQRANKKKYKPEEYLNKNNEFGFLDETPYFAVRKIINKGKGGEKNGSK